MARQEQDFNKELNQQVAALVIKNSHNVHIDLTEIQSAQVLQQLLTLYERHARPNPIDPVGEKGRILLRLLGRLPEDEEGNESEQEQKGELQDVEVNSLLQRQAIHIENCTDVSIRVNQVEVEKVVELGLELVRMREQRLGKPNGKGSTWT